MQCMGVVTASDAVGYFLHAVMTSKDQHQSLTVVRLNSLSQEEFQQRIVGLS